MTIKYDDRGKGKKKSRSAPPRRLPRVLGRKTRHQPRCRTLGARDGPVCGTSGLIERKAGICRALSHQRDVAVPLLQALDQHRLALAAGDAHGLDAELVVIGLP